GQAPETRSGGASVTIPFLRGSPDETYGHSAYPGRVAVTESLDRCVRSRVSWSTPSSLCWSAIGLNNAPVVRPLSFRHWLRVQNREAPSAAITLRSLAAAPSHIRSPCADGGSSSASHLEADGPQGGRDDAACSTRAGAARARRPRRRSRRMMGAA